MAPRILNFATGGSGQFQVSGKAIALLFVQESEWAPAAVVKSVENGKMFCVCRKSDVYFPGVKSAVSSLAIHD
jgi:hypothetical protein